MNQEIIIDVPLSHTQQTRITVNGCPGPSCQQLTRGIESAIGQTTSDEITDAFYQQQVQLDQDLEQFG